MEWADAGVAEGEGLHTLNFLPAKKRLVGAMMRKNCVKDGVFLRNMFKMNGFSMKNIIFAQIFGTS